MIEKLFGKFYRWCLLGFLVLDILSFFAYQNPLTQTFIFWLLAAGLLFITFFRLEYGIYLLLGELIVGSQGHLLSVSIGGFDFSLRMLLFVLVITAWLNKAWQRKNLEFFSGANSFLTIFLGSLIFLIIAALNGILNQHIGLVFSDVNGWLYLAVAPAIFSVINSKQSAERLVDLLLAGAGYVAVKTLIILTVFAYPLPINISEFYRWLRDSRLGEITRVTGSYYRIFLQSQIYVLVGFFISFVLYLNGREQAIDKKNAGYCQWTSIVCSTALIACLSRSFWVGWLLALVCLFYFLKFKSGWTWKKIVKLLVSLILIAILEIIGLLALSNSLTPGWLKGRLNNPTEEAAGMSRLAQLGPLWSAITDHWLWGAGFGQTVTYFSNDPRILAKSPSGIYTTYAFEWGYLDIWLKLGLIGTLVYFSWYVFVIKEGLRAFNLGGRYGPLFLGLVLGIIALIFTSIFSPYLNHPLGIGYLIVTCSIIVYLKKNV